MEVKAKRRIMNLLPHDLRWNLEKGGYISPLGFSFSFNSKTLPVPYRKLFKLFVERYTKRKMEIPSLDILETDLALPRVTIENMLVVCNHLGWIEKNEQGEFLSIKQVFGMALQQSPQLLVIHEVGKRNPTKRLRGVRNIVQKNSYWE